MNSINCHRCLGLHDHEDPVAFEVGVFLCGRAEVLRAEVKHVVDVCVYPRGPDVEPARLERKLSSGHYGERICRAKKRGCSNYGFPNAKDPPVLSFRVCASAPWRSLLPSLQVASTTGHEEGRTRLTPKIHHDLLESNKLADVQDVVACRETLCDVSLGGHWCCVYRLQYFARHGPVNFVRSAQAA